MYLRNNLPKEVLAMWEEAKEDGYLIDNCTCLKCENNQTCHCSFDLYNTENDCLCLK